MLLSVHFEQFSNYKSLIYKNKIKIMYQYKANVIRVIDGDTIEVEIDLGFDILTKRKIRIIAQNHKYFDTPEIFRPRNESEKTHGLSAKSRAEELLLNKTVILESIKEGKYNYVAKVKIDSGDYGDIMINEGFLKKESY